MPLFGFFLFLLCFFGLTDRVHAETWSADFSTSTSWEEAMNARFDDSQETCFTSQGVPHWSFTGHAQLAIPGSLPCEVVAIARDSPPLPSRYTLETTIRIAQVAQDRNILLTWSDRGTWLDFHIFDSTLSFEKFVNGVSRPVPNSSVYYHFLPNTTYHFRIDHDDSLRATTVWINNERVLGFLEPADQPTVSGGQPGLRGSVGSVRSSLAQVLSLQITPQGNSVQLDVPVIRQTDPRWNEVLYDTAETWSDTPTIGRWGCALTSAVMIFQSHGLQQFPNGETLLPDTLNQWLLSQPDGYFSGGNVNWRALSRLSKEISNAYNLPALEFETVIPQTPDPLQWLKSQLQLGLPIILETPGHFVTAVGSGPGENEIHIIDPYFAHTRLSAYENHYLSARVFTPSHTDLRAVLLEIPLDVQVIITLNGEEIVPVTTLLRTLNDPTTPKNESQPLAQLIELSQPSPGTYHFSFSHSRAESIPLRIHSYDRDGGVRSLATFVNVGESAPAVEANAETLIWQTESVSPDFSTIGNTSAVLQTVLQQPLQKTLQCVQEADLETVSRCLWTLTEILAAAERHHSLSSWQAKLWQKILEHTAKQRFPDLGIRYNTPL